MKKRKRITTRNAKHFFTRSANPKKCPPLYDRLFHSAAYFHLRMYAEADYFMIDELKVKAEAKVCNAFQSLLTDELFTKESTPLILSSAKSFTSYTAARGTTEC